MACIHKYINLSVSSFSFAFFLNINSLFFFQLLAYNKFQSKAIYYIFHTTSNSLFHICHLKIIKILSLQMTQQCVLKEVNDGFLLKTQREKYWKHCIQDSVWKVTLITSPHTNNIWFIFIFSKFSNILFFLFFLFFFSHASWLAEQDLSSPTRDWNQATAVKAQNPNH